MTLPPGRTTREIKINNIVQVHRVLRSSGSVTKAEVAEQTGLSIATCGTVLNALCERGEVLALALEASRGGRPAQRYAFNPDYYALLSLYAEGTDQQAQLIWAITSATGERLAQGEAPFHPQTLDTFYQHVGTLLADWPGIHVIGIGLPGVVTDGVVLSCDISLFTGLAVQQQLSARFGCHVQADNDMNYTAWGFYRSYCDGTPAPVAYVHSPGLACSGCGIVIHGELLKGASFFAGEVASLPFSRADDVDPEQEMAMIVASLSAIINPQIVAIAGPLINESALASIRNHCERYIPHRHIPSLIYRRSLREDYLRGIAEQASQSYLIRQLHTE